MHTVQIGCHTGDDSFLDFFASEKEKIDKCLMVEALSSSLDLCKKLYSEKFDSEAMDKISFINKAIVDKPDVESIDFFFPKGEHAADGDVHYTAFSSTDRSHLVFHGITEIEKKEVPAITLSKLFEEFGLEKIDRLYLDAEGLDARILLSVDLAKVEIPFICFEAAHTDGAFKRGENCSRVVKHLTENGYHVYTFLHKGGQEGYPTDQLDWNLWAIKGDEKSLLNEIVEFAGHKSKAEKGDSIVIKLGEQND
jgi:FkbM family methyltransferase